MTSEGSLSIEMEKVMNAMPGSEGMKAEKVLEINVNHEIFTTLKTAVKDDKDKLNLYANLLHDQALLIEGILPKDTVEFSNNICKLMK